MEEKITKEIKSIFKIEKVLRKTTSKFFKDFKEGDLTVMYFYPGRESWKICQIVNGGDGSEITTGTTNNGNVDRLLFREPPIFKLIPVDQKYYRDQIKEYCDLLCLTSGDDETCSCCPLKNI